MVRHMTVGTGEEGRGGGGEGLWQKKKIHRWFGVDDDVVTFGFFSRTVVLLSARLLNLSIRTLMRKTTTHKH